MRPRKIISPALLGALFLFHAWNDVLPAELAFSPDAQFLLLAEREAARPATGVLRIFRCATGYGDYSVARPLLTLDNVAPERGAAWLRDSRRFVFCRESAENVELWLADAAVPDAAPLRLTEHPGLDYQPLAGPGGESIIFCSSRNGDLDVLQLDLASSAVTVLAGGAQDQCAPALTPAGRRLYYLSYEQIRPRAYCLDLQSGIKIEIPRAVDAEGRPPRQAVWSRDSQKLIFLFQEQSGAALYEFDPQTNETKSFAHIPGGCVKFAPDKSADRCVVLDTGGAVSVVENGDNVRPRGRGGVSALRPADIALSADGALLALRCGAACGVAGAPFDAIGLHLSGVEETAQLPPLNAWLEAYWNSGQPERARGILHQALDRSDESRHVAQRVAFVRALIRRELLDDARAELAQLRADFPGREFIGETLDFCSAAHRGRPEQIHNLLAELLRSNSLSPAERIRATELWAEIEFDDRRRFDEAWKHYEAARRLRVAAGLPAEFHDLPPRHQILHTDYIKLIEAYADYFALSGAEESGPAQARRFDALKRALELRPESPWALDWIFEQARTDEQRAFAGELFSRLPADERFPRGRIFLQLIELRQFELANDYFTRQTAVLMQDDAIGWWVDDAVRRLAYPQPPPARLEDDAQWRFLNSRPVIEALTPYYQSPGRDLDLLLALARRAYLNRGHRQVLESLEAILPRLKEYTESVADLALKKMYLWLYVALANFERGEIERARAAFGQAEKNLFLALPGAPYSALGRATDWREWKILCSSQRALLENPEFNGPLYANYRLLVTPLLLLPLAPRPEAAQYNKLLEALFQQLSQARAGNLRALYFHAAGCCYRELNRPDLAKAGFRQALALNPAPEVQLLCRHELAKIHAAEGDNFLLEETCALIRRHNPRDAQLSELFTVQTPAPAAP